MRASSRARVLAVLLCGLLASACATAAQADAVQTAAVNLPPSYQFDPAAIEVSAGQTVTWTNNDHFSHNVHVLNPTEWRSAVLAPGDSVTFTFTDPGEYAYQCDLHPQDMKGKVIVTAP